MSLLALDFDGVLCDSVRETCISAWKAGATLWTDMSGDLSDTLLTAYRQARPVLETGHEAILMMRLLKDGVSPEELSTTFYHRLPQAMQHYNLNREQSKQLYGSIRDNWIAQAAEQWLTMSPLYEGISNFLNTLPVELDAYIITTKQERFVKQILDYYGVKFNSARIYGLDRGLSKEAVFIELMALYPSETIHFIEDRLATLNRFKQRTELTNLRLYLASWGYNTATQRRTAQADNIPVIDLPDLLNLQFMENNA